jgi:enediyne biosynthesis protein E4
MSLTRIPDGDAAWSPQLRSGRGLDTGRAVAGALICLGLGCALSLPGALAWSVEKGFRSAEVSVPAAGKPGFTLVPPASSGLWFTNVLAPERHLTNQILLNGSGVAAGDIDGDGWVDLFFAGLGGGSRLYRNLGNWKFQDSTQEAGVACPGLDATGVVLADLDGDGSLDLVINSIGRGAHIFFNDGQGHFTESGKNPGLNAGRGGSSLALADFDGDGALDLYIGNYRGVTLRDQPNTKFAIRIVDGKPIVMSINGRPLTDPDLTNRFTFKFTVGPRGSSMQNEENGEPDLLCRNNGQGVFAPVSWTDGTFLDAAGLPLTRPTLDWTLSVMFRDLNGDGWPDLYTCSDFRSPDRVWINDGHGHFRALPPLALRHTSLSSMGMDVADINRDGYDDLFVFDMLSRDHRLRFQQRIDIRPEVLPIGVIDNRPQYPRDMLFLNRGDGTYAEIASLSGVEAAEWAWTPLFLDVDLDGYEDLLVANGFERDNMNMDVVSRIEMAKAQTKMEPLEALRLRTLFPRLDTPNLIFRNLGNLRFVETGAAWGFAQRGVSQGMIAADLDQDGDLDIVINNLNGPAFLLRNDCPAPRLAVRLKGQPPNTRGIGGMIRVLGGPVPQSQEIMIGGRYQSSDDPMRTFACGAATNLTIEVVWRSGRRSVVAAARPNRIYEIDESGALPAPSADPKPTAPQSATHFTDVSALLDHLHVEEPFNDFERQPLLPRRLSQLGPGISWVDLDGDGRDDLIIASGRGGRLGAYHNNGHGGFVRMAEPPLDQPVTRDQTTVLGWPRPDGTMALLAGSANYEDGLAEGGVVRLYDLKTRTVEDLLPGQTSSTGPMALADIDGDGQLDLFVGGRVVPGRYAEPASSQIFRGAGGKLVLDPEATKALAEAGLVSGAVFTDLDGDGQPELVLACDWGPVRVFHNDHGRFTERTVALGLDRYLGWWNGVAAGDFDGDGRLDIVASNVGRNTKHEHWRAQPLRLFTGDLDGNGTVDVVLGYFDEAMQKLVPAQPFNYVGDAMPKIRERMGIWQAYAAASLEEIYGDMLKPALELRANCLESMLFLNRGDHFEARELPLEAQLSPAFAVCVGDLDGDGCEDVFLSQNFFAVHEDTVRYDAGRGLWLRGDGHGGFTAVPGQESGLLIYGEQRGAALCDYDGDGRVDLAVSQNAAATKLYRNVGAKPGLRVRLAGPVGNAQGIGAVLRLGDGARLGPAHEIHAGAGYWSEDSSVQVMCAGFTPKEIQVRWPGGQVTTGQLPAGAREIVVNPRGQVQAIR